MNQYLPYNFIGKTALLIILFFNYGFSQLKPFGLAETIRLHKGSLTNFQAVYRPFNSSSKRLDAFQGVKGSKGLRKGKTLKINTQVLHQLLDESPATLVFVIPDESGASDTLDLFRVQLTTPDFRIITTGNDNKANATPLRALHYQGTLRGETKSIAAISISPQEVAGLISSAKGNKVLGRIGKSMEDFIYYDDKHLDVPSSMNKNMDDFRWPIEGGRKSSSTLTESYLRTQSATADDYSCKVVQVYFECEYKMFLDFGSSTTAVTNFVTALFNQVATIYRNEGINLQLSALKIWTTSDPYVNQTTLDGALDAFRATIGTNYSGNIAHLLLTRNLGGGKAFINNNTCTNPSQNYGLTSGLDPTVIPFPSYSWNVYGVAHEIGHELGSAHTQWCGWPAWFGWQGGAIDNCVAVEGTCSPGPTPTNGGTIMSYCHLTGVGINLSNGFGPLPGFFIRNTVSNASCLGYLPLPSGLIASNVTNTGATLSWTGSPLTYSVEVALQGSSTWQPLGSIFGTSFTASGLSSCTNYQWRVTSSCGTSSVANFSTGCCQPPTASLSGNQTINPGQSANLSVTLSGANPWSLTLSTGQVFSNITTSPFTISVNPTATTSYEISKVSNNCASATGTGTAIVTVNSSCPTDLTLSGVIANGTQTFQASQSILSTATINSPANISYRAGSSIKLQTGFRSNAGTYFRAYLAGCSTGARIANETTSPDILIAYPNPASSEVTIEYRLEQPGRVGLYLANSNGSPVKTLVEEHYHEVGRYTERIEISNLQSGIYLYILRGDQVLQAKKLIVQK